MVNTKKELTYFVFMAALMCTIISNAYAETRKCFEEVVLKNTKGPAGFGTIWDPPKGIQYSVWFPIVPRALAVDSRGNIYIGDSANYRVMKFNQKGKLRKRRDKPA